MLTGRLTWVHFCLQVLAVAVLKGISSEGVTNSGNNGQQTPAALPDKPSASEQLSAMPVTEPDGMVLASRAAQQPGHAQAAKPVSLKDAEAKSDTMYVKLEEPSEIAEPEAKPVQPAHAAVSDKELQLAQDGLPDSVQLHKSPSLPAVKSSTKSASPTQQQIAEQPPSNSPRPPTLLSQPTSVAPPTMPLRASKLPLPATASSTRIAMPRGLTSLSSLRTADSIPILKTEAVSSPAVASEPATGSSSAAELAKSEGELQATMQQFEDLLQNTLQRTKEGVHRVREFVLKAAGNPNGKVAARRLIIMVLDYIETAQMHKRIDLFYLMDSLLQVGNTDALSSGVVMLFRGPQHSVPLSKF